MRKQRITRFRDVVRFIPIFNAKPILMVPVHVQPKHYFKKKIKYNQNIRKLLFKIYNQNIIKLLYNQNIGKLLYECVPGGGQRVAHPRNGPRYRMSLA
jgi:hypothetical protein